MKRLLILSLSFPLLASCIDTGYYDDGYYRQPPRARVEVPNGYYRGNPGGEVPYNSYPSGQAHGHYSQGEPVAYRSSQSRHHQSTTHRGSHSRSNMTGNNHGHNEQAELRKDSHSNNLADAKVHSHSNSRNPSVHGHQEDENMNVHGHD